MSGDDTGTVIYLVILGGVLLTHVMLTNRTNLGGIFRQGATWVVIFVGAIAGAMLWQEIRQDYSSRQALVTDEGQIEIRRAVDSHYYLTLEANGVPVRFVIDTGATNIVLSRDDSERIGMNIDDLQFLHVAHTANGQTRTARTMLSTLALGPIVDHNVPVSVNEHEMDNSLLGMDYLERFDRIEISDGTLVLTR